MRPVTPVMIVVRYTPRYSGNVATSESTIGFNTGHATLAIVPDFVAVMRCASSRE